MKSHVDCQHVSRWGGERTRAHQARCQGTNRVLLLNVYDCTSSLCVQLLSCGSLVNYGNVAWFVHSPTLLHVAQLKAFSCGDACQNQFTPAPGHLKRLRLYFESARSTPILRITCELWQCCLVRSFSDTTTCGTAQGLFLWRCLQKNVHKPRLEHLPTTPPR